GRRSCDGRLVGDKAHVDDRVAEAKLVAIANLGLGNLLPVEEGPRSAAQVDYGIVAVATTFDHGVDARDVGVIESQMRARELADLDHIQVELLGAQKLTVADDLEL